MARSRRSALGLCILLASVAIAGCGGRWRPQQAHDVRGLPDPDATYRAIKETLKAQSYTVLGEDAATHTVSVRAHAGGMDATDVSVIALRVDGSGVHLSATGYLVHRDGTTHRTLNAELAALDKQLRRALAASGSAGASTPKAPALAAASGSLPVAWSEPAYDPSVWGRGNFTCLPVKLADEEQAQLTLRLSNGETADVLLSLAHAPELCRSPAECKLPGGCPALGIADADRVGRLASRLAKHEIGPLATLFSRGQAVATIDLSKHGSIAQAIAEKH